MERVLVAYKIQGLRAGVMLGLRLLMLSGTVSPVQSVSVFLLLSSDNCQTLSAYLVELLQNPALASCW